MLQTSYKRHNYTSQTHKRRKLNWPHIVLATLLIIVVTAAAIVVPKYWTIWTQNLIPVNAVPTRSPLPTPLVTPSAVVKTPVPAAASAVATVTSIQAAPVPVSDDWNYVDSNIEIHVKNEKREGHSIYTADVKLSDASFIRTGFAKNKIGDYRDRTSVMAQEHNAILAINGDFYGFRNNGIIIRGGKLIRNKPRAEMGVLYTDGRFLVMSEKGIDGEQLVADGAKDTWSFGPWLIKDSVTRTDFSFSDLKQSNPRAGIGMIEPNHFIFMVIDGRSKESTGITLADFAKVFESTGCTQAYNLDGGGSATMYFNGRVVNNPLGKGLERLVSDIIYIGK